ncbi:MAG: hypothetical protein AAF098_06395 [Pseudomonadota bacterium]
MHVKLQVVIDDPNGAPAASNIMTLDKAVDDDELLGPSLDDPKRLLKTLQ